MSNDYELHSMDYTEPKSGLKYRAKFYADYDMRAPHEEHDGHGVVEHLNRSVEDILDDEDINMSDDLRMRLPLFRELYYERGSYTYYDVIASVNKLVTAWGCPVDDAPAQVDKDFEYLRGWYRDDWHWMCISVTKLDADGKHTDNYLMMGGYESMLLEDEAQLSSVLNELAHELETCIRAELHRNQMELPLLPLT